NAEIRYDWKSIDSKENPIKIDDLKFPKNFTWGVATSAHQVDGNCNCQWIPFENRKNWRGKQCIEQSGIACDHWNLYKDDTKLIKNLGVSSYRFSIEWSKIEPVEGEFDEDAIQHYHDMIDYLLANNIKPMITLHHFTHPIWFEDKQAFEHEENIEYFVRYCTKMFKEFSDKVHMWCTINEPGVYAFQGYIMAAFPPAKKSLQLAGIVNKHLILSHIAAYKAMKAMPNGDKSKIGITHSITIFDPENPNNAFETWLSNNINHTFYDAFLQFFVTGKFQFKAPKLLGLLLSGNPYMMLLKPTTSAPFIKLELESNVEFDYSEISDKPYDANDILDFFGVQPYSHVLVDITNLKAETEPTLREGGIKTDMPYSIYPEIMERAINVASYIGVPIIVTENGIADDKDDRRELYIRRHLYALSKVIEKGYDVRGYYYWSLMDNFEWAMGYGKKFGLYEVDFATQKRTLRTGGKYYKDFVEYQNSLKQ
ncbi:MAG: glycoside hydrolase family 1 protein, partial [Candidatus Babeliales bacterium]|nr:glycoside hydrolase family 1 protein [Candidatus Babeliales bacterium]